MFYFFKKAGILIFYMKSSHLEVLLTNQIIFLIMEGKYNISVNRNTFILKFLLELLLHL